MKVYTIRYSRDVRKALKQLHPVISRRIVAKIEALAHDPRPSGTKKLVQRREWRIRVGDYRVLYDIKDSEVVVLVVKVTHRRDAYR